MKFRLSSLFSLARILMLANGICSSFCRDFCGEQLPLSVTSPRFEEVTQVVPSSAELSGRGLGYLRKRRRSIHSPLVTRFRRPYRLSFRNAVRASCHGRRRIPYACRLAGDMTE